MVNTLEALIGTVQNLWASGMRATVIVNSLQILRTGGRKNTSYNQS